MLMRSVTHDRPGWRAERLVFVWESTQPSSSFLPVRFCESQHRQKASFCGLMPLYNMLQDGTVDGLELAKISLLLAISLRLR
jgi:hypothetical protein